MLDEALSQIRKSSGVLLDANILLLDVIAELDPNLIDRFKRTRSHFTRDDSYLLAALLEVAPAKWTTPHVMTEASGMLGQLQDSYAGLSRRLLLQRAKIWQEFYTLTAHADETEHDGDLFCRLGTCDWGLVRAAQSGLLVLSTDAILVYTCLRTGCAAINFTHFREV